uniref:Uncharacterized protein n=1 Tax=Anguilla anguilla TaxID=7936 RepID=A0A0E9TMK3_ANGAN
MYLQAPLMYSHTQCILNGKSSLAKEKVPVCLNYLLSV